MNACCAPPVGVSIGEQNNGGEQNNTAAFWEALETIQREECEELERLFEETDWIGLQAVTGAEGGPVTGAERNERISGGNAEAGVSCHEFGKEISNED